jgi:tetratricopeptide (TPR) repeat protein
MSSLALVARPLPRRPVPGPSEVPFPLHFRTVTRLRWWRDRCFRDGRIDLALQAATEIARRDPGRESFLKLGFLHREAGGYREALKTLRDALRFREGPRYLIPEIHLHLAHTWFLLGRRKRMLRALRQAYASRPKPRSDGKFHILYGNDLFRLGRYPEAAEEYGRAAASAAGVLEREMASVNRGLALLRSGDLRGAEECLRGAVRALRRADFTAGLATARMALGVVRVDQGQPRRALGMFLRAAQAFRKCGKRDREAEAFSNAGYMAGEIGDWAQSRILLDRAIRLASALNRKNILTMSYACRATALAHLEEPVLAEQDLRNADLFLRGRRSWVNTLHFCRARARISALLGDWTEVRRAAHRAERVASRAGDIPRVVEFRRIRARAEAELGHGRTSSRMRRAAGRLEEMRKGVSEGRRVLDRLASRIAPTEMPVLVVGDVPNDRLDLARRIHRASHRSRGPFVVVPCDQLSFPAAEIGGHERGAWTGADRESSGWGGHARGGTLVLDRVEDLSPEAQRILVPIVDRGVRRVGGVREEPLEARILATCRDPERIIPDLRQRLSAAVLELPPLHEGGGDVARLADRVLRGRRRITADALAELVRYPWPGGPEEIQSVVERLVAFSEDTIGARLVRGFLTVPKSCRTGPRDRKMCNSRQMAFSMA